MRKAQPRQSKATIELTKQGVFQISTTPGGDTERRKIARLIRLRAIGKRDSDGGTFAQLRFRTIHGDTRNEFVEFSNLLSENWQLIKNKLANLGYRWPKDDVLAQTLLDQIANSMPKERFRMVGAPGWYDSVFVIPDQVFARGNNEPEIYVDPNSDGHLGAFVLGEGSLKDWQELVAKPSRQSGCLRLSIAAAFAAPFLRPLGLDSFGINWFSDTSDGKTLCLFVAASVAGLVGIEGLPGWADSQAGIEDLARGYRDCVLPLDETGDGDHQMPLEKKARMLAFLIGGNRPRKLSKRYELNHNLTNREFQVIVLSSSERALGQIARAANAQRLGGEEVRFIDIPASDPNSSGIFDETIKPAPGKTLRETTKELVETLKFNAIKHQGHAFRKLLKKYVNDPHGLDHLRAYKEQFERDAKLPDGRNAHYRIRSNFAVMYAAAALAIDYKILPWKKRPTFRAVEKCMRLALATMHVGESQEASPTLPVDAHHLGKTLKKQLDRAKLVSVKPKKKVTIKQARARQKADGFKINGAIYIKPNRFKSWIPNQSERNALKEQNVIRTERKDTATVERKIGGIKGKPRYYAIDVRAMRRLAAES